MLIAKFAKIIVKMTGDTHCGGNHGDEPAEVVMFYGGKRGDEPAEVVMFYAGTEGLAMTRQNVFYRKIKKELATVHNTSSACLLLLIFRLNL
ncbi:MAG: hypothetical protein GX876_00850 [Bacteroidales bacterium]|nr:hypothetical protein [Bacteroidales bacterium]